jgi:hypothetical protein
MLRIFTFILLTLVSFSSLSQSVSFSYDTAGNRIKRNSAPDLSPTISIDGLNFNPGGKRDFVVNIFEVNNVQTIGEITLRINKPPAFTITYSTNNSISNVFGGIQNQNGSWNFSENANFITVTSKAGVQIGPGNHAIIGFNIARKAGAGPGTTQNLSATLLAGTGGDGVSSNNQAIIVVATN